MLQVRAARHEDIAGIIKICEENLLTNHQKNMTNEEIVKSGFLMSKLESDYAKNMIDDEENFIFLVAEEAGEILGYLTACDISKVAADFQKEIIEAEHKFVYYKQIAKRPGIKGLGTELFLGLLAEAKRRNYTAILCKIVHEPIYNQASIAFHEKNGFKEIRKAQEKNRLVGVYLRAL